MTPTIATEPFPRTWTAAELAELMAARVFGDRDVVLVGTELFEDGRPLRWTRDEYHSLADTTVLYGNRRVMLIDGEVLAMSGMKDRHQCGVMDGTYTLLKAFGFKYTVRVQLPFNAGTRYDPEPDLAVVAGTPRTIRAAPTTALLIVEVSDTTLAFDRGRKASLYASVGIADYWVVNLVDDCLEVYRDPRPDPGERYGHGYFNEVTYRPGEKVAPLALPKRKIAVDDLLR